MEEIQERLDSVETTRRHFASIRDRARSELQALELTNKIEQAKTELASLREGSGPGERVPSAEAQKIEDLERFVQEASIQAMQNITGNVPGPVGGGGQRPNPRVPPREPRSPES